MIPSCFDSTIATQATLILRFRRIEQFILERLEQGFFTVFFGENILDAKYVHICFSKLPMTVQTMIRHSFNLGLELRYRRTSNPLSPPNSRSSNSR